jgi:hypothetical protein
LQSQATSDSGRHATCERKGIVEQQKMRSLDVPAYGRESETERRGKQTDPDGEQPLLQGEKMVRAPIEHERVAPVPGLPVFGAG